VVGSLQVRKWQDKDGGNRYSTEIIADEVNFVDGKNEQSNGAYIPEAYSAPKMEEVESDEALPF
jgi:single-strand DNA-binding protein